MLSCRVIVRYGSIAKFALFVDLHNPCAAFSKAMQADEIYSGYTYELLAFSKGDKEIGRFTTVPVANIICQHKSCYF